MAASLVLILAGCSKGGFSGRAASGGGNVFRFALVSAPAHLDPALSSDDTSVEVVQNSAEGLVALGEDNKVHPLLAESWSVSPDGCTYTFKLKHGVLFHNGREMVADDVKKSLERACSKALASSTASTFLKDIRGMSDFQSGKLRSLDSVKVIDPYTVSITTDAPRPYFLAEISTTSGDVIAVEAIKDGLHIRGPGDLIGTGPFVLESYKEGELLVQRAFERYHGGRPTIDALERPVMADPVSRLAAFRRGEVDATIISRQDIAAVKADPKLEAKVTLINRATIQYLALNLKDWPDIRVRRAIAMCIDRHRLDHDLMQDTMGIATSILPPAVPGHREKTALLPFDRDGARHLLAQAGHPNGRGLPTLQIAFSASVPEPQILATEVAAELKAELGIESRLLKMDIGALIAAQNKKELQAVLSGWYADYIDPQDFLSLLLTSDSNDNHWNYKNPQYDALCDAADKEMNPDKRLKLYQQAEDIVLQDAVFIPLTYWKTALIQSPRVNGIRNYGAMFLPYNTVTISAPEKR